MLSSEEDVAPRRTRKRFTNAQLAMLEHLFHQNSHPSREDREAVAKAGGMEIKSVTIWFQNKRQTERKSQQASTMIPQAVPIISPTMHTFSVQPAPISAPNSSLSRSNSFASSSRPSLDRVASQAELRLAQTRTTPKRPGANTPIWEHLPSSPVTQPVSPPQRDIIDFGRRRTLEWACAAARFNDRTRDVSPSLKRSHPLKDQDEPRDRRPSVSSISRTHSARSLDFETEPEDDDHEAITPPSTWGKGDMRWTDSLAPDGHAQLVSGTAAQSSYPGTKEAKSRNDHEDPDVLKAALALCGLGRR